MSSADKDAQASAVAAALAQRSLLTDTSHILRSRSVLQVAGDLSGLFEISIGGAPRDGERGRFISLLTEDGYLDADLYIIPHGDEVLIDVHTDLANDVAERLASLDGVTGVDPSAKDRWRVFGELPDQKGAETPFETIRYTDSRRRELGARVLREAIEPEGFDWRHERKWAGHAMRLGLLPDHLSTMGREITPQEAGYHKLVIEADSEDAAGLGRRILPVRIDPTDFSVPVMTGAPLVTDGREIGTMLDHEGVCGIGLIDIEPWREALAVEARITCLDEPVLLSWPTWLSAESEGRRGPAGDLI